jgi:hypothetical protein
MGGIVMKNLYQFLKSKLNIDKFIINKILLSKDTNNFEIEILKFDNRTLKSEILTVSFDELNDLDIMSEIAKYFRDYNTNNKIASLIDKINYKLELILFFLILTILFFTFLGFNILNPKYVYKIYSFEDYEFEKKINELGNDGWELVFARRALKTKNYGYYPEYYEGVYECIFRKRKYY